MRVPEVVVALLCVVCVAPGAAQAPDPTTVRELIDAGRAEEARRVLASAPRTVAFDELRFDLERAAGNASGALHLWERLNAAGVHDWKRLHALARDVARGLRSSRDASVRLQACAALLTDGAKECAADVRDLARDGSVPAEVRLRALARLAAAGDAKATDDLRQLAQSILRTEPLAAIDAVPALGESGVVIAAQTLADGDAPLPQRYQAAYLLGDSGRASKAAAAQARGALQNYLQSADAREPVILAATIARARVGTSADAAALRKALPRAHGFDRFLAGLALAERGESDGQKIARDALGALSEQSQLEAAVRLAKVDRAAAVALLTPQLTSANPVARLSALSMWPRLGAAPVESVRRALLDPSEEIRAAAVVANTSAFEETLPAKR